MSVSDPQHNNALPCAECRYAESGILFAIMVNIMLNVSVLGVVMLRVVAPSVHLMALIVIKDVFVLKRANLCHGLFNVTLK
jgi:hypothetical protein